MRPHTFPEHGFTLTELLLALCLTLIVIGSGLALVISQTTVAQVAPEAVDRQQRARMAASILTSALTGAGAGLEDGPWAGALIRYIAPVVPRRVGLTGSDVVATARPDAITLTTVPWDAIWATTNTPITGGTTTVGLDARLACAWSGPACGIVAGMTVLIFDTTGRHGLYRVTGVAGGTLTVRGLQSSGPVLGPGAAVVAADLNTYYFDAAAHQLRVYDGYLSDVSIVDDVVDVSFEYWGDPEPPRTPRPPEGEANCLYDADGHAVSGLGRLATNGASLARLPLDQLRDGPWCGEGDRQFDADLLRVRTIRLRVRAQAHDSQVRAFGPAYALPGTNTRAAAAVPDLTLVSEVAPRNFNLGR